MKYTLLILVFIASCQSPTFIIRYPQGGYDYPTNVSAADRNFYFYPLKDIESRRDSFYDALQDKFYQLFDEPNLSLKPAEKDVFRFVYTGFKMSPVIISLTNGKLIVKKGLNMGNYGPLTNENDSILTPIEKKHLYVFERYFPYDTAGLHPYLKRYLDSMTTLYPQLLDTKYFRYLIEKKYVPEKEARYTYTTKTIQLTNAAFLDLINKINASGYWKLPRLIKCDHPDTDGDGFSLEANTKMKYNIVNVQGCSNDSTKFTQACQQLIHYAQVGKNYNLIWDGTITSMDSAK